MSMKSTLTAIRVSVVLMLICGLLYPLVTTGAAGVLFPKQAKGSLAQVNGTAVGSELIAQDFQSPKLFHPRASNAKYDPTASAGSNMMIASPEYVKEMKEKIDALRKENPNLTDIPADLVTVSGSGFDPDLSPEAAMAQVPRISKATGISEQQLNELVDSSTKSRQLGVFGEPRVNVLEINMELMKQLKL
ncbi:potassium-transporting ATPase subunit KdpC [Paenibacillus sp. OV219]|uniref:potassium-transporting ATPase subunit KdpC n=1 Tax=Paenibacillus sp. OV219 TaxID=1884377 RepID=UPI0008B12F1F|nr:potassium-transporting ATPase subunit KdpC [Paenibacillus sp. OV219]SEP13934.1 K+-transporting ATPase ATPase C chain [Paenibacillus sp. OV219]